MQSVYNIIQELKATRSLNEKKSILEREKLNDDLKEFFRLALDKKINFYQKKEFTNVGGTGYPCFNLSDIFENLKLYIVARLYTGNEAIDYINTLIDNSHPEDVVVLKHVLQKESGCDVGASIVNKIWPVLIPEVPFMLATAYSTKLAEKLNWSKGVYSQLKSDGGRVAIIIDYDSTVSVVSRAGNELNLFGHFDFLANYFTGVVLDGELLTVKPDGTFNDRKTSNGFFTKCVRGTLTLEESKTLHLTIWDSIPLKDFYTEECAIPYNERLGFLESLQLEISLGEYKNHISLIPTKIVHSIAEAQTHYQEMLAAGEEGTMLKEVDMLWENRRSKKVLKLKAELTADLKVTGYKDGKGDFLGNLGSLEMETSDSKVQVSMSGFSLKLRSEIYANLTKNPVSYYMVVNGESKEFIAKPGDTPLNIGSVVEITYNEKIKPRNSEIYSLFLPRFEKLRDDKTVANSEAEVK